MTQAEWACEIARDLLAVSLPRRWAHTQGVATQAQQLVAIEGLDTDVIEAAAWLHDIGYAPDLARSGLHPLDGARYLRDVLALDDRLCRLVAYHSCAIVEASERGLERQLTSEFEPPPPELAEALIFCDMTTGPDGSPMSVGERLADIWNRYDADHVVARSIRRSESVLREATAKVVRQLAGEPSDRLSVNVRARCTCEIVLDPSAH